jgi:hypothetical protein
MFGSSMPDCGPQRLATGIYSRIVRMTPQEMADRLKAADRSRVGLRRATIELAALGKLLLETYAGSDRESPIRSERSDRGAGRSR